MSLLTITQDVAAEVGFPQPSSIVGSSDQTAKQLLRLVNREGEYLSQQGRWEVLVKEHTFTLATGDQDYALPADYRYIIPGTTWNRGDRRIVLNPVTSREWQYLKGWQFIAGLNLRARIRNNQLEFEQTIDAGDDGKVIAFEYLSKYWSESAGSVAQQKFAADSDLSLLDEELMTQGVIWRFRKAKGLDWEPDYQEYSLLLKKQKAQDGGSRTLRMGGSPNGIPVGVNVPDQSYGV